MSETKLPDHIDLRVNEETSIALPGVGVSGYVWQLQKDGDVGVAEATLQREPAKAMGSMVGRAASDMLVVRAIAVGSLTVHLSLRRPWERDGTPLQSHSLVINVT
jgi:predicted secreted protein